VSKRDDFLGILDKVTVIIVPRFNMDGAYAWNRGTTSLAPVGHAGLGTSGLDMNRDFMGFESVIVRTIRQLQIGYDPIVSLCAHEMNYIVDAEYVDGRANGYRRGYEPPVTTSIASNVNLDQGVRDLGRNIYEPATKSLLESRRIGWNWYRAGTGSATEQTIPYNEVVSSDGVTGPLSGDIRLYQTVSDFELMPEEGIGINGVGLGNQSLVFVHESANPQHASTLRFSYLRRVYAHYTAALAICQTAASRLNDIMPVMNAARVKEIAATEPISFWGTVPPTKDDLHNVFEYASWQKVMSPDVILGIRYGTRPIKAIRAWDSVRDPAVTVTRPVAYIIPKEHYEAAIRLFYTGVKLERLTADQALEVETYTVNGISSSPNQNPSGSTSQMNRVITPLGANAPTKITKTVNFSKDSFIVRMDQLGASYAALALEPSAIRNYGNYYLSRTQGASGNTARIPAWYRDTFLPVEVGQDFPIYRYVKTTLPATYPANMNLPMMLTMVEKVHSPTQEEVAEMKKELGFVTLKYISKFELPVLSSDISYKTMANVSLNEAFMLPNGDIVDIKDEFVLDGNKVILVAPKGLDGSEIYAAKKGGGYLKVYQKELDPVAPEEVLAGGKAPTGAEISGKKLVWTTLFKGEGVILSNKMLAGYKIAYVNPAASGAGYTLKFEGDKVTAHFEKKDITNGIAEVYLIANDSDPADGFDKLLIIEFKGKTNGLLEGCNAGYPLIILLTLIPFIAAARKKWL
jgi:hypothetical protein